MSSDERIHAVDGGDARLDELSRIFPGEWIDGAAVYVEIIIRDDSRAAIGGSAAAVEYPTEHVLRDRKFDRFSCETDACCRNV